MNVNIPYIVSYIYLNSNNREGARITPKMSLPIHKILATNDINLRGPKACGDIAMNYLVMTSRWVGLFVTSQVINGIIYHLVKELPVILVPAN